MEWMVSVHCYMQKPPQSSGIRAARAHLLMSLSQEWRQNLWYKWCVRNSNYKFLHFKIHQKIWRGRSNSCVITDSHDINFLGFNALHIHSHDEYTLLSASDLVAFVAEATGFEVRECADVPMCDYNWLPRRRGKPCNMGIGLFSGLQVLFLYQSYSTGVSLV